MSKIPPPESLLPYIEIINTPSAGINTQITIPPRNRMRARCINCSDRAASDCFGCLVGRPCEYYLIGCKTEDREVLE